jgi:hypothetical protein
MEDNPGQLMIETLDELIHAFGLRLELKGLTPDVRTAEDVIQVNPQSGNILKLMTAVGKCLHRELHPNPAVQVVICSYTGWHKLLEMRRSVSERLLKMLLSNASIRAHLNTLTVRLMVHGMTLAFLITGNSYLLPPSISSTYPLPSDEGTTDVQSWLESSLPSFPPDITEHLRRFINRL